ncbi:MAG: TRAP transporter substrate-binding protein DctP [Clostridiales Family XIII bacterium]|jgi:TRAP-type C4-dicarboxylate transport system substrate-binding protein|nr:TRAP transporter substrate-binding protein DctP [Clostridiales Family XIII bacterium]
MKSKKSFAACLAAVFVSFIFAACSGEQSVPPTENTPSEDESASATEVITLNWVSFRASNHQGVQSIQQVFFDKINERTNGRVVIEYKGGPEVMSPSDLGMAIKNGAVDVADLYMGAYASIVPGVGGCMLTQYTPMEERENGAYDFIAQMHEQNGIKYLGRPAPQESNYFYTYIKGRKAPETQSDISALRIGTAAGSKDAVAAWGVNPTNVAVAENYEALQSGIVDAIAGQPMEGAISSGWDVMCNYVIDHPYYQSTTLLIMNLSKWNSLPEDIRDIITECVIEGENEVMASRDMKEAEYRKTIEGNGVEFITLPPDVADWYLTQAYEGSWAAETMNYPDVAPRLREMITK